MMASGIKRKPESRNEDNDNDAEGAKTAPQKDKRARLMEKKRESRVIKTGNGDHVSGGHRRRGPDLPAQIGVDAHLEAHAQEIIALRAAMARAAAKEGSNVRAWQMLPRHARRRNASHNLLALPKRLRNKGRAELRASKTEPRSRSESRHRRSAKGRSSLGAYPRRIETRRQAQVVQRALKSASTGKIGAYSRIGRARQANAWLETHLWHAKRFRMSSLRPKVFGPKGTLPSPTPFRWGFSLAEEPSLKSHRASWRAQKSRVTVMDCSYEAWIRVVWSMDDDSDEAQPEKALGQALANAGLRDGWEAEKWGQGTKYCDTAMLSVSNAERGRQPSMSILPAALAPVQVIWIPEQHRRSRQVLLKTHPASIDVLYGRIRRACQTTRSGRIAKELMGGHYEVSRLNAVPNPLISAGSGAMGRRHGNKTATSGGSRTAAAFLQASRRAKARLEGFNNFQIVGPKAASLLTSVLRLLKSSDNTKKKAFHALASGHAKVEPGTMLALDVHDPRLSFPPKKRVMTASSKSNSKGYVKTKTTEECEGTALADGKLFTHGATLPTYTKGDIDSRRARLAIPGSRLLPGSADDIVPVVVLCGAQNRYNLIVPRGWGKAFWLSLVHGDPGTVRVIGQVQARSLQLDSGLPFYPHDWTGTAAGRTIQNEDAARAQAEWGRKPPAKRVNYERMGIRFPWGGEDLWETCVRNGSHFEKLRAKEEKGKEARVPWMLATSTPSSLLDSKHIQSTNFGEEASNVPSELVNIDKLVQLFTSGGEEAVRFAYGNDISRALVFVRVTACRKGAFGPFAEIHHLREKDARHWRETLEAIERQKESGDEVELHRLESKRPAKDTLVGAVTTGDYSLTKGRGQAVASISLIAWLDLVKRDATRMTDVVAEELNQEKVKRRNPIPLHRLVVVRNTDSGVSRAASLDLVHLA